MCPSDMTNFTKIAEPNIPTLTNLIYQTKKKEKNIKEKNYRQPHKQTGRLALTESYEQRD